MFLDRLLDVTDTAELCAEPLHARREALETKRRGQRHAPFYGTAAGGWLPDRRVIRGGFEVCQVFAGKDPGHVRVVLPQMPDAAGELDGRYVFRSRQLTEFPR